jgi:DNA-directed RNA polymerase specialized sigma24 family protein
MSILNTSPGSEGENEGVLDAESLEMRIAAFRSSYIEITDPKTSTGRIIYGFVRRDLRRFRMDYPENFVLNEVFLRANRVISQGDTISNLSGWIKGASFRVILEMNRKRGVVTSLDSLDIEIKAPEDVEIEDFDKEITALKQAILQLPAMDGRLLHLKVVEGRSWAEISSILRVEGYGNVSEAAWRKRKERALTRLRKLYHQILPSF